MPLELLPVDSIVVGERLRGSVAGVLNLATSIREVGLLHPIVVNSRHELIAGARRLAAVKKLFLKKVICHVVDSLDDAVAAVRAEMQENVCREPLAPSEIAAAGKRIEALEKAKAKERQKATLKQNVSKARGAESAPRKSETGKTREKVAQALGVSHDTYEKAKAVVTAAEAEPEKYGDLPAMMDATSTHAAHKELNRRQKSEGDALTAAVDAIEAATRALKRVAAIRTAVLQLPSDQRFSLAGLLSQMAGLVSELINATQPEEP